MGMMGEAFAAVVMEFRHLTLAAGLSFGDPAKIFSGFEVSGSRGVTVSHRHRKTCLRAVVSMAVLKFGTNVKCGNDTGQTEKTNFSFLPFP